MDDHTSLYILTEALGSVTAQKDAWEEVGYSSSGTGREDVVDGCYRYTTYETIKEYKIPIAHLKN